MVGIVVKPQVAKMKLINPGTDEPLFTVEKEGETKLVECSLHVVSRFSKQFRDAKRKMLEKNKGHMSLDAIEEENTFMLAALVVGWDDTGVIDEPYSPEGALELLTNPENGWIVEQLNVFTMEKEHFFVNGVTS